MEYALRQSNTSTIPYFTGYILAPSTHNLNMTMLCLLPEELLLFIIHFMDVNSALSLIQVGVIPNNLCRDWFFHLQFVDLQASICAGKHKGILVGVSATNAPQLAVAYSGPF